MAGARHPVSVRAVALVQMERLQTFTFSVLWSDDSDTFVRRSWDEFRQLQKILKETFPVEAGLLKRSDRVLPKLPDVPLLGRRRRTGLGLARLRLLDTYVQALLASSERVSRSAALTDFFAPQVLDLESELPPGSLVILPARKEEPLSQPSGSSATHSLQTQSMRCLQPFHTQDTRNRPFHAQAQESLDVLLQHPSGWWLVANQDQQTAWFPAPYLEKAPDQGQVSSEALLGIGTQFCATRAYEGSRTDELSVPVGARVRVLETSNRGWWLCRYNGRVGLLPAVLLRREGLGSLLSGPGILGSRGENRMAQARAAPPATPSRPCPSAIQSRCCTITRRALRQYQGAPSPP